jgi:hypothetical protein
MRLSRKEFLLGTLGGVAGLVGLGCSGSSSTSGSGGNNGAGGSSASGGAGGQASITSCAADIADNHPLPHQLDVVPADVAAGADKSYDIQGAADHNHTVVLTAADFAKLAAGSLVAVASSVTFGHSHECSVQCS